MHSNITHRASTRRWRRDPLAADLLRCHVVERPNRLSRLGEEAGLVVLGKAEVRHICATLAVEQDVRRLQIAVDELMGVKRPNALGYLQAKGDRRLQL